MRASAPLPKEFDGKPFRVRDARAAGVTRGRLRGRDLVRPFHALRASSITSLHEQATAYALKMPPHHAYGGVTAARLWGLPISRQWNLEEPLVIARVNGSSRGRAVGTRAIAVHQRLWRPALHRGLRLLTPAVTALTLARDLDHEALVQVVDALLTDSVRYPDLALPRRPHMTPEQLHEFAGHCRGLVGARALAAAVDDARVGVDSRFETITRLLIVTAELPEPEVHPLIVVDGLELHPDLGYPEWRIAIEYEGKQHLDTARRDGDIDRYALFEAAGWITVPVTKGDMARSGARFIARLARAIARRR